MSNMIRAQLRQSGRWTRKAPRKPAPPPPVVDPIERVAPPAKASAIQSAAAKVRATLRRLFGKRGA